MTLQTLAHSIGDDKTVASDSVKVPVNETNTADAAEDAQSMDSAESVAPAETAEARRGKRPRKRAPGPDAGPCGTAHGDPGDRRCPG